MQMMIKKAPGDLSLEFITDFYLFLASVLLISLSGVLMPGPLFAVTIRKAAKSKSAGALNRNRSWNCGVPVDVSDFLCAYTI